MVVLNGCPVVLHLQGYYRRGDANFAMGRFKEAVKDFKMVRVLCERKPVFSFCTLFFAQAYLAIGGFKAPVKDLKMVRALYERKPVFFFCTLFFAHAYLAIGGFIEPVKDLKMVRALCS
jgi:hypothetical protein